MTEANGRSFYQGRSSVIPPLLFSETQPKFDLTLCRCGSTIYVLNKERRPQVQEHLGAANCPKLTTSSGSYVHFTSLRYECQTAALSLCLGWGRPFFVGTGGNHWDCPFILSKEVTCENNNVSPQRSQETLGI